jgi:hypothetical protein
LISRSGALRARSSSNRVERVAFLQKRFRQSRDAVLQRYGLLLKDLAHLNFGRIALDRFSVWSI